MLILFVWVPCLVCYIFVCVCFQTLFPVLGSPLTLLMTRANEEVEVPDFVPGLDYPLHLAPSYIIRLRLSIQRYQRAKLQSTMTPTCIIM